jgi:hypothetical protein
MSSYESNQSTLSSSSSITLSYTQLTEKEIKIISSLSKLINVIIKKNLKKKKNILSKKIKKDKFFSLYIPTISIYDYIYRIIKFTQINISTLIISFVQLNNYLIKTKNYLCINNFFNLYITSCLINAKFYEDNYCPLSFFAKVGGVSIEELESFEFEFCNKLNFSFYISEDLYIQYYNYFLSINCSGNVLDSEINNNNRKNNCS